MGIQFGIPESTEAFQQQENMAKVAGPVSVVKVCASMLCVKIGYW